MIIDIKQEMLIYKSIFEIIALFLNLPSLDECPYFLWKTRMDSLFLMRPPQQFHCTNESSLVVGLVILGGWQANHRGICIEEAGAWYSSQALE